ncbi:FtsH protease activity modulator HflK [Pseudoxanthomonas daejeonensis]|uniref:Protein HflK n=1 Tax=Pseudoxanthomonas daejeonensis TaxID=266062 RepID=A0ABQ6Z7S2_9GAMM|nr:FtsH protease activity modulator HflK [Pseudoxanthomonas daejeonensis]KAF1694771.1 FtsH protease activity modulator HflK [Pseudoxanthomonas daejeonensis]UNK56663.1 FtsH protease activity modulator HflK [Pseudoxanthomonas daejeonensis]
MVWNTPGSGGPGSGGPGKGGDSPDNPPRNPWPPRRPSNNGGSGLDGVLAKLRDLFGGGNGAGFGRWILLGAALLVLLSSFQLVGEQQRGVVLRFGQFARVMEPGPNLKWPWPVERVIKVNATQIKTFSNTVPVLTRDENIVSVTMNVQYRVGDPRLYLFGSRDADRMLEQVSQSVVREQVGRANLDTVLGARGPLSASAAKQLQASLDAYRTGLVVTELNLQDARPPEEVKPAFDEVNSAQQIKDQLISEARAYAARVVPEARGEAARRRTVAEGYKAAKIAQAEGDAARFSLLRDEYRNAPEVTRKRLWLETVQDVLSQNRKVVGADSRQLIYVPMPAAGAAAAPAMSTPPPEALLPAIESSPEPARSGVRDPVRTGREEPTR